MSNIQHLLTQRRYIEATLIYYPITSWLSHFTINPTIILPTSLYSYFLIFFDYLPFTITSLLSIITSLFIFYYLLFPFVLFTCFLLLSSFFFFFSYLLLTLYTQLFLNSTSLFFNSTYLAHQLIGSLQHHNTSNYIRCLFWYLRLVSTILAIHYMPWFLQLQLLFTSLLCLLN